MSDIDDITSALAAKYNSGLSLDDDKKKEPSPLVRREYSTGGTRSSYTPPVSSGPKLFPSDRMALRSGPSGEKPTPKRPIVLISTFSDDDLEWMLSTPAKRHWEFADWLEVIGLPRDLHERHDSSIYGYAARAFLTRKQEAHRK